MIIIVLTIKYGSTYYNTFTMGVVGSYMVFFSVYAIGIMSILTPIANACHVICHYACHKRSCIYDQISSYIYMASVTSTRWIRHVLSKSYVKTYLVIYECVLYHIWMNMAVHGHVWYHIWSCVILSNTIYDHLCPCMTIFGPT